jgi:hypothetical protein
MSLRLPFCTIACSVRRDQELQARAHQRGQQVEVCPHGLLQVHRASLLGAPLPGSLLAPRFPRKNQLLSER